jgi:hypothetical protein
MVNLAETIQFSGPEIAMILLILLGVILATGAIVVAGCIFARRAGKGSRQSLIAWGLIALVEIGFLVFAIIAGDSAFAGLIAGGAIAVQAGLYVAGRTKSSS